MANLVTQDRLNRALDALAREIDRRGEAGLVFLPVFERLEAELQAMNKRSSTLEAVRNRLKSPSGQTAAPLAR